MALASPTCESNPELQACRQLSCLRPSAHPYAARGPTPTPPRYLRCHLNLRVASVVTDCASFNPPALSGQEKMQANLKPTAAPGDGAPASEDPALIKMSNQHTKLSQARSEEPAPTKLNDQRMRADSAG